MVREKHADLWTWGMKWVRHYRWIASSGRIDCNPKLIKPFQENVLWIQQQVDSGLTIPGAPTDGSTAVCHATIRLASTFVTYARYKLMGFFHCKALIAFICRVCDCSMIHTGVQMTTKGWQLRIVYHGTCEVHTKSSFAKSETESLCIL